jgi:hypothetical protein
VEVGIVEEEHEVGPAARARHNKREGASALRTESSAAVVPGMCQTGAHEAYPPTTQSLQSSFLMMPHHSFEIPSHLQVEMGKPFADLRSPTMDR